MLSQTCMAFFLRETRNKMFTPDFQATLFNTMKVDPPWSTFPSLNVVLGISFSTQERKSYRYRPTTAFVCVNCSFKSCCAEPCCHSLTCAVSCCLTASVIVFCCTAEDGSLTQQNLFYHGLSCAHQLISLQSSPAGMSIIQRHTTTARTLHEHTLLKITASAQAALISSL